MRKLLIALVVIIIAVVALLGYAVYNIDSLIGPYKDDLIAQAEQQTGRKVKLASVNVNIWGGIGVRLQDFAVSEDPAFGSGNFVEAKNLQVNVKLLPLLSQKIEVSRIILNDPVINLVRNQRGVFNFASLSSPGTATEPKRTPPPAQKGQQRTSTQKPAGEPTPPKSPETGTGASSGPPLELVVSRLEISNGQLKYSDKQDNSNLELKQLDLTVEDFSLDNPFRVLLAVAVLESKQNVNLDGMIGPIGASPKPDSIPINAKINITALSFDSLQKALPEVKRQMPKELQISGGMQAKDLALKGNLSALAVAGALDLTGAGFKFGNMIDKPEGTALRIATVASAKPKSISVTSIDLTFNTLELKGKGTVGLGTQTAVDFTFDVAPMELQGWDKIVPLLKDYQLAGKVAVNATVKGGVGGGAIPDIKGKATLENVAAKAPGLAKPVEDLSAAIDFSGKSATLQQTSLRVGKTRMTAKAQVQSFSPLALTYEFSSPAVWLADFQPRGEDEVLKEVTSTGQLKSANGLSFEGNVTSPAGSVAKLDYTGFRTDVDLKEPWLTIKTVQLNALKGTINGKGKMQITGESPQFSFDSQVRGIDIKEYVAGAPGMPTFEGIVNADVTASGRGKDWEAMKPTITGKGKAEVVNGKLLDFNIAEQVLQGVTGIPGLTALISNSIKDKYPQIFKGESTEFEQLNTVFNAANSKASIEQLNMKAKDYGVTGQGWIDFDGKTDVASVLSLSKDLSADLASAAAPAKFLANDKGHVEIPFVLSGTMPNVRPAPDVSHLASLLQKNLLNKGISELTERFIPGMGKSSDKDAKGKTATGSQQPPESKGIMGIAEQMIPGLGGAAVSKSTPEKEAIPKVAEPATTQGKPAAKSEPTAAVAEKEPVPTAAAQDTQAAKTPEQPKEPKKKPSTEEQVQDAIMKGLKLFGQ